MNSHRISGVNLTDGHPNFPMKVEFPQNSGEKQESSTLSCVKIPQYVHSFLPNKILSKNSNITFNTFI